MDEPITAHYLIAATLLLAFNLILAWAACRMSGFNQPKPLSNSQTGANHG